MIPTDIPTDATILVVEDDPGHAMLIQEAFAAAQLANPLHVVSDGEEAIAYLEGTGPYADRDTHPLPVLVLLDIHMPKRSGLDVLEWMRGEPELKRVPVIMLTASEDDGDIDRAYELGANSYLIKPVGFDALLDVVRTLGLYWLVVSRLPSQQR